LNSLYVNFSSTRAHEHTHTHVAQVLWNRSLITIMKHYTLSLYSNDAVFETVLCCNLHYRTSLAIAVHVITE